MRSASGANRRLFWSRSRCASLALLSAVDPCSSDGSDTQTSGTCGTWDEAGTDAGGDVVPGGTLGVAKACCCGPGAW